jgi:hypothetical protein
VDVFAVLVAARALAMMLSPLPHDSIIFSIGKAGSGAVQSSCGAMVLQKS